MTTQPAVPGALNISQLSGSEEVAVAGVNPEITQTTTRDLADLALSPTGNSWVVNETTGKDTNPGTAQFPFATLTAALAAATALNGDIIFLQGTVHLYATLNWNKNGVSLVGVNAPSNNDRARISSAGTGSTPALTQTQATALGTLVNVTGVGCAFVNVAAFQGFAGLTPPTSPICWAEAGGRNFYKNVQFFGGGDTPTAALANMRSLTVAGAGENLFSGCTIGLDTITRATNANASLEFLSGTPRNVFRRCIFQALVSTAGDMHVKIGADGIDRYVLLEGCTFINCTIGGPGATAMTAGIVADAAAGGVVLWQNSTSIGATAAASGVTVYLDGASASGNGATIGLAVVV